MKRKSPTLWMGIFLIVVSLLAVLIGFCRHFAIFAVGCGNPGNNPNDFYLWSTNPNSTVAVSFRYDPREADLWQFRCAAREQIWTPER
jgi:hypothetical protein